MDKLEGRSEKFSIALFYVADEGWMERREYKWADYEGDLEEVIPTPWSGLRPPKEVLRDIKEQNPGLRVYVDWQAPEMDYYMQGFNMDYAK
tara:strand:- start:529 stop:801 length:273 start_codon:yes stop_codon:yes gene_type:complete